MLRFRISISETENSSPLNRRGLLASVWYEANLEDRRLGSFQHLGSMAQVLLSPDRDECSDWNVAVSRWLKRFECQSISCNLLRERQT